MTSVGKRVVTTALCALLAVSPLVGCASDAKKADDAAAKEEEVFKEVEEPEFKGKKVPYSRQGAYTVTFGEGDLLAFGQDPYAGESLASGDGEAGTDSSSSAADEQKQADEKAAADAKALEDARAELEGAKAARDEAQRAADEARAAEETAKAEAETAKAEAEKAEADKAQAQPAQAEAAGDDAAKAAQEKAEAAGKAAEARAQADDALAKAEEAAKAAEQRVAELEAGAAQASASASASSPEAQQEAKAEDKKAEKKAFADVKLEDVKVYYSVLTNQAELEADESGTAEPQFEEREAKVNALANDNGSITLSFTDPDAASNAAEGFYSVAVEALGKYLPVMAESAQPQLSAESDVKADSESCDVTVKAEGARFADGLNAGDLKLGGSFAEMQITGAEASGDTLTVHLSGRPKMDYDVASVITAGQIVVPASGFEGSAVGATALVDVALSDEAYDVGDEGLPAVVTSGEAESSSVEGDTGRATVYLDAELGDFKDVGPESIALGDTFADGKVESVTKDGERLKVELTFPVDGEMVGDHVLAGTVKLAAGAMEDESGKDAPEIETLVALAPVKADDKKSEEDKKKEEEEKKKKEEDKKKEENSKTLKKYSDGFKYAADKLKKVDPTVAELAKFYGEAFSLAANVAGGKYLDALKNVESLLQICGIIEPDAKEVTAADVLEEVKALRMVIEAIDRKIDESTEESRADRYTATSIRLARIRARCKTVGTMFEEGAKILANRKDNPVKPPAKGASREQLIDYNAELCRVILQEGAKTDVGQHKTKAPTFLDAKNTMVKLNEELFTVVNWVSIDKNAVNSSANPINVFDKLVASKVNWDSQGYYARLAFRTELKCTILSAFSYLAVFYNYEVPLMTEQQKPLIDKVAEALQQIDARPAGISPEQVRESNAKGKDFKVYSPTLGVTIKKSRKVKAGRDYGSAHNDIGDGKIVAYAAKALARGSRWNDLQLAGLEVDNEQNVWGIGFGVEEKCYEDLTRTHKDFDQWEGSKNRRVWTNILMNNTTTPGKYLTSIERWDLFKNNSGMTETKVEDYELYPFPIIWFDRA